MVCAVAYRPLLSRRCWIARSMRTVEESQVPCSVRRDRSRTSPFAGDTKPPSVVKEIMFVEPRPQSPWGSRRLQRQPLPRARQALSGLPNGVEL